MMNTIADFLSADWADAVGWTLLHSIRQSAAILLIVIRQQGSGKKFALPGRKSTQL